MWATQVNDIIGFLRLRFEAVLRARISPKVVSKTLKEFTHQHEMFKRVETDMDDLYRTLFRSFDVWQGTLRNTQTESSLELKLQQECPFRAPDSVREDLEAIPGRHVPFVQGFDPFGYDGKLL